MDFRIQQLTAQGHLMMSAQRIAQLEVDLMESDRRIMEANQRVKDAESGGNSNPYNITTDQVKDAIKTLQYLDR